MTSAESTSTLVWQRVSDRLTDVSELVKARLTTLVLMTTVAGFILGKPPALPWWLVIHVLVGTGLVAAGAAILNQLLEMDSDAKMERTRDRPLPASRMTQENALFFGALVSGVGIAYLIITMNYLSGALAAATLFSYLFLYTPLKKVTPLNTLVGAASGALPPVIGWAAATGSVSTLGWTLFAIQFLWQMPHFFAIGWLCRDDYASGQYRMLAVTDPSGKRSAAHSLFYAALLPPVVLLPVFLQFAGWIYGTIALLTSLVYAAAALKFLRAPDTSTARRLFFMSLIYLPIVLTALILDS